jgi:D-alanyl-D-alanine dipeptidase
VTSIDTERKTEPMTQPGTAPHSEFAERFDRLRAAMRELDIDCLLVGPSTDMVYLIDFPVRQSERMTILVLPAEGQPRLVMPAFELDRIASLPPLFEPAPWEDGDDPAPLLASLLPNRGDGTTIAVGGQMFTHFFLRIQDAAPSTRFVSGDVVLEPVRMRKSPYEVDALRAASAAADAVFEELLALTLVGMSERELLADIHRLLLEKGHDTIGGGIVGAGANGAAPHHGVSDRRLEQGDAVVVDFGGVRSNYRSDITRTFHVGEPSDEFRKVYAIVDEANKEGFEAVRPGVTAAEIDSRTRNRIDEAGYGPYFLHRTGHGIGLDGHEAPYLVRGDDTVLEEGMTFSIEPGIYLEGRFGVRIEDIVVVTASGAERLNRSTHELQLV